MVTCQPIRGCGHFCSGDPEGHLIPRLSISMSLTSEISSGPIYGEVNAGKLFPVIAGNFLCPRSHISVCFLSRLKTRPSSLCDQNPDFLWTALKTTGI